MRSRALRGALTMVAAIGVVFTMAAPASAAHFLQHFEMHNGRISVGGVNFDSPGAGVPGCPEGDTTITSTINDTAGTITVALHITAPFQNFLVGTNFLNATGSGHGTYNPVTRHANVTIALAFTIRAYSHASGTPPCTPGAIRCAGTAHMNVTIQLPGPPPVPNLGTVYANSTSGSILTVSPACPGALGLVVTPGASLGLGANPNIQPPQPGAHFTPIPANPNTPINPGP